MVSRAGSSLLKTITVNGPTTPENIEQSVIHKPNSYPISVTLALTFFPCAMLFNRNRIESSDLLQEASH